MYKINKFWLIFKGKNRIVIILVKIITKSKIEKKVEYQINQS